MELATIAAGCFWCSEAIFKRLQGINSVISGFSGGDSTDATYYKVSSGDTRHAESIQLSFDPQVISFAKILEVFFATHNPTTPNQQGADIGPQYRSIIFYHSNSQKKEALDQIAMINKESASKGKVVTEVLPFIKFYPAEKYHQNYYDKDPSLPYCQFVINPKLDKLLEKFAKEVKKEYQLPS
jgi:methionine-S-sulfoxide reductase